jgi:hypothetical protein
MGDDDDAPAFVPDSTHSFNPVVKPYSVETAGYVRIVYIIAVFLWCLTFYLLGIYRTPSWPIFFLPLMLFTIGIINATSLTNGSEEALLKTNSLSLGLLITIPLLSWITKEFNGDKRLATNTLLVGILFSMFSFFDVWVVDESMSVYRHIKSSFQTISIALIASVVINFCWLRSGDSL